MCVIYEKGAIRPPQNGGVHIASAVLSASSPPADDDFDKGFTYIGLATGSRRRGFHPKSDRFTTIMDSGASDHFVYDELIPGLRQRTSYFKNLECPRPRP